MPWTPAERYTYSRQLDQARRQIGDLHKQSARETFDLLRDQRDRVLSALSTIRPTDGTWKAFHVPRLLRATQDALSEFGARYERVLSRGQTDAIELGAQKVERALRNFGNVTLEHFAIDPSIVELAGNVRAELVTDVTTDMIDRISAEVRRAALGELSPWEAVKRIGGEDGMLEDPSVFRSTLLRGEVIVRTEVQRMYSVSTQETLERAADTVDGLKKQWIALQDDRVRTGHGAEWPRGAHLQAVAPDEPFLVPVEEDGEREELMYPGDPNGSPENTIQCVLPGQLIEAQPIGASKAWYAGQAIEMTTRTGKRLAVTPNHPVLTMTGFCSAGSIKEGDYLLVHQGQVDEFSAPGFSAAKTHYKQNAPTRIEEVFKALALAFPGGAAPVRADDFHGDARFFKTDVCIVGTYGELLKRRKAVVAEHVCKFGFEPIDSQLPLINRFGSQNAFFSGPLHAPDGVPRTSALPFNGASIFLQGRPFQELRFGSTAGLDTCFLQTLAYCYPVGSKGRSETVDGFSGLEGSDNFINGQRERSFKKRNPAFSKPAPNGRAVNADFVSRFLDRSEGMVSLDKVIDIRRFDFTGHVYDLQTVSGIIVTDSLLQSNCRCDSLPYRDEWLSDRERGEFGAPNDVGEEEKPQGEEEA